jgi:hypothetical protein
VQCPEAVYVTGNPELAVATTVKLVPFTAVAGAGVINVMVWLASRAVTKDVTSVAGNQ